MRPICHPRILLTLSLISLLAACGGGGGSGGTTTSSNIDSGPSGAPTTPGAPSTGPTLQFANTTTGTVYVGSSYTLSWNSPSGSCSVSGAGWNGQVATSGSVTLAQFTPGQYAYVLSCGGQSAGVTVAVSPAGITNNSMTVTIPTGAMNSAVASVTVCQSATSHCVTIPNVLLDTGSIGLRLRASAPGLSAVQFDATRDQNGSATAACGAFPFAGVAYGALYQMDVKLAGEVAHDFSVQVIGSATGATYGAQPTTCALNGSTAFNLPRGFNGILGIGPARQAGDQIYGCSAGSCVPEASGGVALLNPVAGFEEDNNGFSLTFPGVPANGVQTLTGVLTFGIGTQSNNAIPSTAKFIDVGPSGTVDTVVDGRGGPAVLDTGTSQINLNDSRITACSDGTSWYCPSAPLIETVQLASFGTQAYLSASFSIAAPTQNPSVVASPLAASATSATSAGALTLYGLPFYFGRTIYQGIQGSFTPNRPTASAYGYWAMVP